jgi:aminoglycoside 6-adenylyltransferase
VGFGEDSLTVTLLDKDNRLPQIPPPSDVSYYVKKPTEQQYLSCCNNFWWCLYNTAKAIKRDHLTNAMNMYIQVVHNELEKMVGWHIGVYNDFSVNLGSWGRYFKQYLSDEHYQIYVKTYSDADYDNLWDAIFTDCGLFRDLAADVGVRLGYSYNLTDDENMTKYLELIHKK